MLNGFSMSNEFRDRIHPAMTHLFEMGDKCLNYGGIWWQGWCHPPVFPGTSCKLATGHRTCRNAENVIGNDVASGMLPLAVSRQIPTKPVTFCWVGGSIPGINQANQNQPCEHSLGNPWMLCILGLKMWRPQSSTTVGEPSEKLWRKNIWGAEVTGAL